MRYPLVTLLPAPGPRNRIGSITKCIHFARTFKMGLRESLRQRAFRPQLASSRLLARGGLFTPCAHASIFFGSYSASHKSCGPTRGPCISRYPFDWPTKAYRPDRMMQKAGPRETGHCCSGSSVALGHYEFMDIDFARSPSAHAD